MHLLSLVTFYFIMSDEFSSSDDDLSESFFKAEFSSDEDHELDEEYLPEITQAGLLVNQSWQSLDDLLACVKRLPKIVPSLDCEFRFLSTCNRECFLLAYDLWSHEVQCEEIWEELIYSVIMLTLANPRFHKVSSLLFHRSYSLVKDLLTFVGVGFKRHCC